MAVFSSAAHHFVLVEKLAEKRRSAARGFVGAVDADGDLEFVRCLRTGAVEGHGHNDQLRQVRLRIGHAPDLRVDGTVLFCGHQRDPGEIHSPGSFADRRPGTLATYLKVKFL